MAGTPGPVPMAKERGTVNTIAASGAAAAMTMNTIFGVVSVRWKFAPCTAGGAPAMEVSCGKASREARPPPRVVCGPGDGGPGAAPAGARVRSGQPEDLDGFGQAHVVQASGGHLVGPALGRRVALLGARVHQAFAGPYLVVADEVGVLAQTLLEEVLAHHDVFLVRDGVPQRPAALDDVHQSAVRVG